MLKHFPRLDGLRAVAIILVFWAHFFGQRHGAEWTGGLGVRIFFVLSGYLITRILLTYKDRMDTKEAALTFYWKRALRLFPAFYVGIAIAMAIGLNTNWAALTNALYLTNFYVFYLGHWHPTSHFWSLAVEEQFYLFWFPVVMMIPRRYLAATFAAMILLSLLFNLAMGMASYPLFSVLPFSATVFLAAGGLYGLFSLDADEARQQTLQPYFVAAGAVGGLVTLVLYLAIPYSAIASNTVGAVSTVGLAIYLISVCTTDEARAWSFLASPVMMWLGKVSYGLYVYHLVVYEGLKKLAPQTEAAHPEALSICGIFLSIFVAFISWHLVETPFLRLKNTKPWRPNARQES